MSGITKIQGPIKVGSAASDPSGAENGLIYYNTTSNEFRMYTNGSFQKIADQSTIDNLTIVAGDVAYERVDGSKKNVQASSDDVETALTDIDDAIGDITALGTPTNYSTADETEVAARLAGIDTAIASAGGTDFADDVFRISGSVTSSKKLAFEVDGLSASTTRTITMPDADVNLGDIATNNAKPDLTATTDNRLVKTDTTANVQESGITVSDLDEISGVASLTVSDILIDSSGVSSASDSQIDYSIAVAPITTPEAASQLTLANIITTFFNTSRYTAQEFISSASGTITDIDVNLYKSQGTLSGTFVLEVREDNSGEPGALVTNGTSNTLDASTIATPTSNIETFTFTNGPELTSGQTYWFVVNPSSTNVNPSDTARLGGLEAGNDTQHVSTSTDSGATWGASNNQKLYHVVNLIAGGDLNAHKFSPSIAIAETVDSATTGANQILALTTGSIRLTNASLTSLDGIADPSTDGYVAIITNSTGSDITITDGATVGASQTAFVTGTGANFTLKNEASTMVVYKSGLGAVIVGGGGLTDAEVKTAYENNADTNEFSDAEQTKLAGIEAAADVTDATNVAAAGAVMESDTSTALMSFVIDEDTMSSDSATKVPTQQSVKAYVDNTVSSSTSYIGGYNASTNTPDLDTSPSGISKGDQYTVTADGTFFTTAVEIGDVLIAEIDNPTVEADWTIVNKNLDAASIKTQYESNTDTNAFTDAEQTKLTGIETSATADQTGAEIKAAYEAESDTNAFTDAEKTLLGNQSGTNTGDEVAATDTVSGIVELATNAEVSTGTDTTRAVTPAGLANRLSSVLESVLEDTTPQLGGALDVNGFAIEDDGADVVIAGQDSVKRAKQASKADFIEEEYIHSIALSASQTDTVIASFTFAHATIEGLEICYKIKEATSLDVAIGTIRVVTNGSTVSLSHVNAETASTGITFDAAVNGANVEVTYSSGANGATMRADVKKFLA